MRRVMSGLAWPRCGRETVDDVEAFGDQEARERVAGVVEAQFLSVWVVEVGAVGGGVEAPGFDVPGVKGRPLGGSEDGVCALAVRVGGADSRAWGEQVRDRRVAVGAVVVDGQVEAAHRLAAHEELLRPFLREEAGLVGREFL